MSKRAILYARTSGNDSTGSTKDQIALCTEYCNERGYNIIAVLAEDETKQTSGHLNSLPELDKLMDMAYAKQFDILVVKEMDRLSRKLAKQMIIEDTLTSKGIEIEYVLAQYDDSPEGRLSKNVRAIIAEYEREKIRERLLRGKWNKIKSGSTMFASYRPFGYQIVTDESGMQSLEIDAFEAQWVRKIFEWYLSGESFRAIAKRLTDMRVPTVGDTMQNNCKIRGYGEWERSSIRKIIRYRGYIGEWTYGKNTDHPFTLEIPPIIDIETFEHAQKQIAINKQNSTRNKKYDYLMSGHVICGECNQKMQGITSKRKRKRTPDKIYQYYICYAACKDRHAVHCSNKKNYPLHTVENAIWQFVCELYENPEMLEQKLLEQYNQQQTNNEPLYRQLESTKNLIEKHTKRKNSLVETLLMLPEGSETKIALVEQIAQLETTIKKLEAQQNEYQDKIESRNNLTHETINNEVKRARQIKNELQHIEDFETKRKIIERMNVNAVLYQHDGKPHMDISCYVSSALFVALTTKTCGTLNTQHISNVIITHTFDINAIAA